MRTTKGPNGIRGTLALGVIDFGMMVRSSGHYSVARTTFLSPQKRLFTSLYELMYRNLCFAFFHRSQSDIPESDRYGLIGLVLGLKNRDLSLTTENLLKVEKPFIAFTCVLLDVRLMFVFFASKLQLGFLEDATQVDMLVPRLRKALKNATGGSNKASELSFSQLQIELDTISRDNLLKASEL